MAGKVLVSTREHIDRLIAARLQCDIMGTDTVIIARTDAEAATLLDSNIDARDHPYILGTTNIDLISLNEAIAQAQIHGHNMENTIQEWEKAADLCTYHTAVSRAIGRQQISGTNMNWSAMRNEWNQIYPTLSHDAAKEWTRRHGLGEIYWDWEKPRTREGYYRIHGGIECW